MSLRSYRGHPNQCINILGSLQDTTVDGGLYMNENKYFTIKEHLPFLRKHYYTGSLRMNNNYLNENNNNNNNESSKRSFKISSLLNEKEVTSILEYIGNEDCLLGTGVCELLQANDGQWIMPRRGVICLIKDNINRLYSISLLRPKTSKVIWHEALNRSFQTSKEHDNLVTFQIMSNNDDSMIYGLNFVDPTEAEAFHNIVTEQYESFMQKRRNHPKRRAPEPPSVQSTKPIVLADDCSNPKVTDLGVQIPQNNELKKEKNGIFSFLGKKLDKKKKKKTKPHLTALDISAPTHFKHIEHQFSDLTPEQQEAIRLITVKVNVNLNEEKERELIKSIVMERHEEIRASVRPKAKEPFARRNSGLADARSSIMIPKAGRGNTPREIKRTSFNKRSDTSPVDRTPTPAPSTLKDEASYDPLHPNWEEATPPTFESSITKTQPMPISQHTTNVGFDAALPAPSVPEIKPALPTRTASRSILLRQNTPPHPSMIWNRDKGRPRLPTHIAPAVPPSETPPLSPTPTIVPPLPPPPVIASVPVVTPAVIPPVVVPPITPPVVPPPTYLSSTKPKSSPANCESTSIPVAPPPPPPNLLASEVRVPNSKAASPVPPVSPDRRNFLEEIQNVDKSKLLKSINSSPSQKQNEEGSSLMDSIQKMIDTIRPQIEDSDSDDDEEYSDSDWSE